MFPADNETFIRLLRLAQEDEEFRTQLLGLLALSDFHRQSVLGSVAATMRLRNAPPDLISAIEALRDADVAQKARELIGEKMPGRA